MKIIQPSVALVDDINPATILAKIERCGRVSHQSQPREETVGEFVRNESAIPFVRMLIKCGHESVLEHVSLTFHIITDRAIQNELVRHRHASFTVESTRYVQYDELEVVEPPFFNTRADLSSGERRATAQLRCLLRTVEETYQTIVKDLQNYTPEYTPEDTRAVLPLCLKSELYMTANLRELRHILKLRTDKAAHPQMRFIAGQILAILRDKLPVIVEDIQP